MRRLTALLLFLLVMLGGQALHYHSSAQLSDSVMVEYTSYQDLGAGISVYNATGVLYQPYEITCGVPGYASCYTFSVLITTTSGLQATVDLYFDDYWNLIGLGATTPSEGSLVIVPATGIPLGLPEPTPTYVGYITFHAYQNGAYIGSMGPYEVEVVVEGPYTETVKWVSTSYTGDASLKAYNVSVTYKAQGLTYTLLSLTYTPDAETILALAVEDTMRVYNPIVYASTPPPGTPEPAPPGGETVSPPTGGEEYEPPTIGAPLPGNTTDQQPSTNQTGEGGTSILLGLIPLGIIAALGILAVRVITGRRRRPPTPPPVPPPTPPGPPAPQPPPPPASARLGVATLQAAPGARVSVPVSYSCPTGCTLQLVPQTGLQASVSPPQVSVRGEGTTSFTLALGPGARAGQYSVALHLNGVVSDTLQVAVLETGLGEAEEIIPGYRLISKLGSGGFSTVYLAERVGDGRRVAVKVPKISFGETIAAGLVETFRKEAETWSKLQHPNIVEVLDYGVKPIPYIVMEYMEGGSLRSRLEKGPLPLREAISTALGVAEALSYAHHLGVIHRDIKPENVLFDTSGTPKLTDFGLAKVLLEASVSSAAGGTFKGTLLYAAPEQIDPKTYGAPDWRTDVWQFGALLYETLTGRPPFQAESPVQLIQKIVSEDPPPPSSLNKSVPSWLDDVVMRCLAKRKEDRWRSMDIVIERIRSNLHS